MTLTDLIVRRIRPKWVHTALRFAKSGYETFGPIQKLALPRSGAICIVAPHPDDDVIGCGGLLALWAQSGRASQVVFLTRGEMGSAASRDKASPPSQRAIAQHDSAIRREGEAHTALAAFEGVSVQWLDGPDSRLYQKEADLAAKLASYWRAQTPTLIAAPCPLDRHADHAVAARIVSAAAEAAHLPKDTPVWGYEVWSPTTATGVLDITNVAEKKWAAIACHHSQLETTDYLAASKAMAAYRAITAGLGSDSLAEAYRVMTVQSYGALSQLRRV